MLWDFRNLIRRGGDLWPRSWKREDRRPIRPPEVKPLPTPPPQGEADEQWLTPPWQPPRDSGDAWKKPE
jgi:hypothetical protein